MMRTDFTNYLPYIVKEADRELADGPIKPEEMKDFWGLKLDSQLVEWLKNVEVLPYHLFPDGSVSLNFTGREFKNWLRSQEKEYREKYV